MHGLENRHVPKKKRGRRHIVARSFGLWLQTLRKQTDLTQEGAASEVGISDDGVKRIERGENVSLEFILPFLQWLDEKLIGRPELQQELREQLYARLMQAGRTMRGGKDNPQPQLSAAVGRSRSRRKTITPQ